MTLVFSLLHTPPSQHGFNRTTWKLSDLRGVLRAQGQVINAKEHRRRDQERGISVETGPGHPNEHRSRLQKQVRHHTISAFAP
jgi:hypothetical protein